MTDSPPEDKVTESTLKAIQQFNDAFNRLDVNAIMAAITEDCVFENTYPPPDGERYEGRAAVRAFWERFFASGNLRNRGGGGPLGFCRRCHRAIG